MTDPDKLAKGEPTFQDPTRVQRLIGRRAATARATIPEFELQVEVTMNAALATRQALKAGAEAPPFPTLTDLVIKACALAIRRHPRINASYTDAQFELHSRVNIGLFVATEDGFVIPTIYDADLKPLQAITDETSRLIQRARQSTITPAELAGATFSICNLGMFGVSAVRPVINPPQIAVLGVGAVRQTLARVNGDIVDRQLMTLTLSSDHRILFGSEAAEFLADLRSRLEAPSELNLDGE